MSTGYYGEKYHGRTAIYRFYDRSGQLLYLGITCELEKRWQQHQMEKFWWRDVSRKEVVWVDTRAEAAAIEYEATRTEKPLYDRFHRNARIPEQENRALGRERAERVIEAIKHDIQSGAFPARTALPQVKDLLERYDSSPVVVQDALWTLESRDWLLARVHGRRVVYDPRARVRRLHTYDGTMYLLCRDTFGSEPFTVGDVHERTKLSKAAISKHLSSIRDAGLAEMIGHGRRGQRWWTLLPEPPPAPDENAVTVFYHDDF